MATSCEAMRRVSRLGLEPRTYGLTCRRSGDETTAPATTSDATAVSVAHQLPAGAETDPDLARIVSTWPDLPPHIRAAVLALIGTAR